VATQKVVSAQLGMDTWELARTLFGHQLAVAIYRKPDAQPETIALIQLESADDLARLRERIDPILVLAGDQLSRSEVTAGTETIDFNGRFFFAIRDRWLLATNSQSLLDETLARLERASPDGAADNKSLCLADDAACRSALRHLGPDHLVLGYLDSVAPRISRSSRPSPASMIIADFASRPFSNTLIP
jgi:hypothetical protein